MRVYRRNGGRIYWASYYDATAKRTERCSTRVTERAAAIAIGARLERDAADPDGAAAATATLADALDAVIAEYEQLAREGQKAPDTVDFYQRRARQVLRMIAEGLLPPLLADIRARNVDMMIDHRRAEGSSRSTIAKDLIVLRLALKLAKRRGQWAGDVDAVLPHRFGVDYQPRERWLTPADVWALLPQLRYDRACWVAYAIATGANLSETQKARRDDVKAASVHLRGTKRKTRDRHAPLVFPWQRALLDLALTYPGASSLFPKWSESNMNRDLKNACERAGIARCSSNDLRRTFGTWMRASGAPLELLAPAMGHGDTRMVERVYARLDVTQLAALLGGTTAVHGVYVDSTDGAHQADSADGSECLNPLQTGSDCWTRTSDPVINSHSASVANSRACIAGVLPLPVARCRPVPDLGELPGLAKGVAWLGLYDVIERYAAGLGDPADAWALAAGEAGR